jgi:hypothetical protein
MITDSVDISIIVTARHPGMEFQKMFLSSSIVNPVDLDSTISPTINLPSSIVEDFIYE